MRYLYPFLLSLLVISIVHAQDKQEPIRVCVSMLKNSSREYVNPTWQRNELIKAFERINKSKDVRKGKLQRYRQYHLNQPTSLTLMYATKNAGSFCIRI